MGRLSQGLLLFMVMKVSLYASFYKEISLQEGESIVMSIPSESGIKLPRRSVVDVQYIGHDEWRIMGLKRGTITLRPVDKAERDDVAVLVEVSKKSKPQSVATKKARLQSTLLNVQLFIQKQTYTTDDLHGISPQLTDIGMKNISSKSLLNRGQLVSSTSIETRLRHKTSVRDGGEFQVQYDSANKEERVRGWKSYGMMGNIEVESLRLKAALINFDIKLSSQLQSGSRLQSHQFKGITSAKLGKLKCLGSSFLSSSSDQTRSNYYLHEIPIIGPLFQLMQEQDMQTQVFLWARVLRPL